MDGQFFSSWDLWQKLIFILACSIVLLIVIGCIAFSIAKGRTNPYATPGNKTKMTSKNYSIEDPEMSLGVKTFDGRTLSKGVKDYKSRIPSFTVTPMSKHSFSSRYDDLTLQGSDHGEIESKCNTEYFRLDGNPELEIGTAISTDVAEESTKLVRPSTPNLHRSRSTCSQSFHTLHVLDEKDESYEDHQSSADDRETLPSAHIFQMLHKANRPEFNSDVNSSPRLASSYMKLNYRTPEADLSLLNSHRLSHVAETGQLTPRDRRRLGKSPSSNIFSSIGTESTRTCSSGPDVTCVLPEDSHLTACGSSSASSRSSDSVTTTEDDTHSSHIEPTHAKMYSLPHINVSRMEVVDLRKENAANTSIPVNKEKSLMGARKVNPGFEVLAQGTLAKQQLKQGSEEERKQHKKQHQKKGSPDLSNKLLRKLRKSVSKGFS